MNELIGSNLKENTRAKVYSAMDILKRQDIIFDVRNNGLHLIVEGSDGFVDYWPTSGKFICRNSKESGFGLNNLLRYCK